MLNEKTYADIHKQTEEPIKFGVLEKAIIAASVFSVIYFCGHVVYWFMTK